MTGKLYIMRYADTNQYKIGVTKRNVEDRRRELQTGAPLDITIEHVFYASDAYGAESKLHDTLYAFDIPGGGDEWFQFDDLTPLNNELSKMIKNGELEPQAQIHIDYNWWYAIRKSPTLEWFLIAVLFSLLIYMWLI